MLLEDLLGTHGMKSGIRIAGLTADSREVKPGFLFAALAGTKLDGRAFVKDAIAKGAVAVIGTPEIEITVPHDIAFIASENPRRKLAEMAARYYGPQPDTIVAITGTNGKTSIASFMRQIWGNLGVRAASIGTLGVVTPDGADALRHTTPDPVAVHRILATLKERRIEHVALEASSHGLAQFRLDAVRLKAAAFTNLTRDHMDYHPTFDDYEAAKIRLFTEVLPQGSLAVINRDGARAEDFEAAARGSGHRVMTVGVEGRDLKLVSQKPHAKGQDIVVEHGGKRHEIKLSLPGAFQSGNALVAAALAIGLGNKADAVFAALESLTGAPGRLELAGETGEGAPVFIDYAHTPDALVNVLKALRPHTQKKLHVVFGCGGDRDQGKRPMMGEAAIRLADRVIVTDDNPRTEDAGTIRNAILKAAPGAIEIGDRALAIIKAIGALDPGDVLVIAGKGHETGQIIGKDVKPFNDLSEAKQALRAHGGRA
jgi:UDP-N-acetylmuramoyl-L-alanyl-D-glutamate--2,6-diaminopimelate ligase